MAVGEQLSPLTETMVAEAPDELSGAAEDIDAAVQSLIEGDAEAFNAESTVDGLRRAWCPARQTRAGSSRST